MSVRLEMTNAHTSYDVKLVAELSASEPADEFAARRKWNSDKLSLLTYSYQQHRKRITMMTNYVTINYNLQIILKDIRHYYINKQGNMFTVSK